jgi:sigma-B regulation protein RsbU (phosphoserine phosphatase)
VKRFLSAVWRDRGLAFKLILLLFLSNALIFFLIFSFNFTAARGELEQSAEANARNLAAATANRIESLLRGVETVPETLAIMLETSPMNVRDLEDRLRLLVSQNSDIYGMTVSFDPYAFTPSSLYYAPYASKPKGEGESQLTYLGSQSYQYFYLDWFQIPKLVGLPLWSEPFYDEGGGGIIMATYSVPFYTLEDGNRRFQGVVTADISLAKLSQFVAAIKIYQSGYGFLISQNGTFITNPQATLVMNESLFSVAESQGDDNLRQIGRAMIHGESGFVSVSQGADARPSWLAYSPLPSSGWSLGVIFPQDELMAGVANLNRIVLGLVVIGFIVLFLAILFIAKSVARPIVALAAASRAVARGELDAPLPLSMGEDEVGQLTNSFFSMQKSLRQYIRDLKETTAAKERIESELKIAARIQMDMVPVVFPDSPHYRLCASMKPAREVGGDLYDFNQTDEQHLYILIGDVSGKGVPASLMMATTVALFRAFSAEGGPPEQVMTRLNEALAARNESMLFVTAFCGLLDLGNGMMKFCSAGHNPPFLLRHEGPLERIETPVNLMLAVQEGITFRGGKVFLAPGESLFTYTDGVTEAMGVGPSPELYGEERLIEVLQGMTQAEPEMLLESVRKEVEAFVRGADPSDDITMLALQYLAPARAWKELRILNRLTEVEKVAPFLEEFAREAGVLTTDEARIGLILDELVTNVLSYAYGGPGEQPVRLRLRRQDSQVLIRLEDEGYPFNPLEQTAPSDLEKPLEERQIGGLGIYIVRQMANRVEYARKGGINRLTVFVDLGTSSPANGEGIQ